MTDGNGDDSPGPSARADESAAGTDESVDADPFSVLSNETRLRILDTLYEQTNATGLADGCSYSTLRTRAAVADKGNFNYHLDVLRNGFVEKAGDEYRLTFSGFETAKMLRASAWRSHESRGPVEIARSSPLVDGDPLVATYEDSLVRVHPPDGDPVFQIAVRPAGATHRDVPGLVDVMSGLLEEAIASTQHGVCPYCHAPPERSVVAADGRWTYRFVADCPECGPLFEVPVGAAVVRHPAVVSFYWRCGVDVREERAWNLDVFGDDAVTPLAEDPLRLQLTVERDDASLTLTLDAAGTVVESVVE
ncbi:ArsR/SmtB family transcription factor [Halopelagius longus]|uniref:ArsR family transcriptional regulator n=1 Tax=Halopelagius longus TaxID=1236180 RepID=A0A1H1G542_9EURY|nr:winged helix-turn-helix domain-containing protein [Halopelagius longus]RDI69836.1 ArsR family transcriptional regulator [Halopelagius longus]SDR08362.1 Helix-turn-helix domain-containing protein [Halopelagius longus]